MSQTEKLGVRGLAKMTHGLDPAHRDRPRDTGLKESAAAAELYHRATRGGLVSSSGPATAARTCPAIHGIGRPAALHQRCYECFLENVVLSWVITILVSSMARRTE